MSKPRFNGSDVQRAVRGARAGGFDPDEICILPTGEIRLRGRREQSSEPRDVTDEITEWERRNGAA